MRTIREHEEHKARRAGRLLGMAVMDNGDDLHVAKLQAEIDQLRRLLIEIDDDADGGQRPMSHGIKIKLWKTVDAFE